jgi:hypothetical protein
MNKLVPGLEKINRNSQPNDRRGAANHQKTRLVARQR